MGILRTAGRAAVASSVHGRVQRRQQSRWAAQDQAAAVQPVAPQPVYAPAPAAPAPAAPAGGRDVELMISQLERLGALRDSGVLTEHEFEAQKARILAG